MQLGAPGRRALAWLAWAWLAALTPSGATAQLDVYVVGKVQSVAPRDKDEFTLAFECRGTPTCEGLYKVAIRFQGCSNLINLSGRITLTGMSLAQSGPVSGTVAIAPGHFNVTAAADGTCSVTSTSPVENMTYAATWDRNAQSGSGTFTFSDGLSNPLVFKADLAARPPIFPLVVRSTIGPQTASASVDIQFRAQDIGSSKSVFVFATAPATRVRGSQAAGAMRLGKADASTCVIAQLDASGSLVAVSNSQFQAALSGVLSAQGATVSVMNNVATPSVSGASFYVGYGSSGAAMLDEGVFRNAVLVPGSGACPPLPYVTALWWNPSESGWGLNLNQQGNTAFATLFTYDAGRAPSWFVMSGGVLQPDGLTFAGDLYRTTGPAFNADPFTPLGPGNVAKVGTMSVELSGADSATLTYSIDGAAVSKLIQRQVYGSRSANCMPSPSASRSASSQYQDLWWNAAESGWGINLTQQDNTIFGTLFTYDASGRDLWLVMSGGARQPDGSFAGDLFKTAGPVFNAVPFTPVGASDVAKVGTMQLRFADGDHGTLTYTYAGSSVTKAITRQVFSSPVSACN